MSLELSHSFSATPPCKTMLTTCVTMSDTVDGQFLDPDCENELEKESNEYNFTSTDDDDDNDANWDWEDLTGLINQCDLYSIACIVSLV